MRFAGIFGAVLFATACAESNGDSASSSTTSGGDGGTAGSGGAGGHGAEGGGGRGGDGGEPVCGDGRAEPPEDCDGGDFAGLSCEALGLGPGMLVCNAACHVIVSACSTPESCLNGLDDDGDGLVDCTDSDCGKVAQCLDSCASPDTAFVPASRYLSNLGRPDSYTPACAQGTGPERVFRVTPSFDGVLGISVTGQADFNVAVVASCGNVQTELACASHVHHPLLPENLQLPVDQGTIYYVVVDGSGPAETSFFSLGLEQVGAPEQACGDLVDGDLDGALDCDDGDCQQQPQCAPGAAATGAACLWNQDCAAAGGDPICLPDGWGFAGGYCSEFCTAIEGCTGDALCFDYGISPNGICLDGCSSDAECRMGYACRDVGLASKVCYVPPESACNDHGDDDVDALTDCEDPDCQGTPPCLPGSGAPGTPCSMHTDCAAIAGGDPYCIDGWPGGYCTEFCGFSPTECPPGSACIDYLFWPSGAGNCFETCNGPSDCPPGYGCHDVAPSTSICAQ
jgi:hypothetical protein